MSTFTAVWNEFRPPDFATVEARSKIISVRKILHQVHSTIKFSLSASTDGDPL